MSFLRKKKCDKNQGFFIIEKCRDQAFSNQLQRPVLIRGLYIGKYPPKGGEYQRCHLGEKIWKGEEKKGGNVKKTEERGKKMRKGEVKA